MSLNDNPEEIQEGPNYDLSTYIEEEDLYFLSEMAAEICKTKSSVITLIKKDAQYIKSSFGVDLSERMLPKEFTFCSHTLKALNGVMVVKDSRLDSRFKDNPFVTGKNPIIFYAGVTLKNEKGSAVGTICAIDNETKEISKNQISKLEKLAKQVIKSLELKQKTKKLESLNGRLKSEQKKYEFIVEGTETATFEWNIKSAKSEFSKGRKPKNN